MIEMEEEHITPTDTNDNPIDDGLDLTSDSYEDIEVEITEDIDTPNTETETITETETVEKSKPENTQIEKVSFGNISTTD